MATSRDPVSFNDAADLAAQIALKVFPQNLDRHRRDELAALLQITRSAIEP